MQGNDRCDRFGLQAPGYQWLPGDPYVLPGHPAVYGFNNFCSRPNTNTDCSVTCDDPLGTWRSDTLSVKRPPAQRGEGRTCPAIFERWSIRC